MLGVGMRNVINRISSANCNFSTVQALTFLFVLVFHEFYSKLEKHVWALVHNVICSSLGTKAHQQHCKSKNPSWFSTFQSFLAYVLSLLPDRQTVVLFSNFVMRLWRRMKCMRAILHCNLEFSVKTHFISLFKN